MTDYISSSLIVLLAIIDAHLHLRSPREEDYGLLDRVIEFTKHLTAAVIMGNTKTPITTAKDADWLRNIILKHTSGFTPVITIMLARGTTKQVIHDAWTAGVRVIKFIPAATSTNAAAGGITLAELRLYYDLLRYARDLGMIFSIHLELAYDSKGNEIPWPLREKLALPFIRHLIDNVPGLKIVFEHVSTWVGVRFIVEERCRGNVNLAGSITSHHPIRTIKDVLDETGQIRNIHHFCLPIFKRDIDRAAVRWAMVCGLPCFFFGSDSAPHLRTIKEQAGNPVAGIFSAPVAIETVVEIFEAEGFLNLLPDFLYGNMMGFYGLDIPLQKPVTLIRQPRVVPREHSGIMVFRGGETLRWSFQ